MNTGQKNNDFFTGKAEGLSSNVDFTPLNLDNNDLIRRQFNKYNRGNFSAHIFKMIPTFYGMQIGVIKAILKNSGFNSLLDLGCSEGGFIKALAQSSNKFNKKSIHCHGIDANDQMISNFYNSPQVDNATIKQAAFLKGWDNVPTFDAVRKYDVITEFFLFQFMSNNRVDQIFEAKKLLKKDGLFISGEKFLNCFGAEKNEIEKRKYQSLYFSPEEITKDKQEIIQGMQKDMIDISFYFEVLKNNFKYVSMFWSAGNFKGFVASDSKVNFDNFNKNFELIK